MKRKVLLAISHDTAYKGCLIRRNPMTGAFTVSKGGSHISFADSIESAEQIIDLLA